MFVLIQLHSGLNNCKVHVQIGQKKKSVRIYALHTFLDFTKGHAVRTVPVDVRCHVNSQRRLFIAEDPPKCHTNSAHALSPFFFSNSLTASLYDVLHAILSLACTNLFRWSGDFDHHMSATCLKNNYLLHTGV